MAVAVDENVQIVIKNLKDMLSKYHLLRGWSLAGPWLWVETTVKRYNGSKNTGG